MIEGKIVGELINNIFYAGIFYGIMGVLSIEGLAIVIRHLIEYKKGKKANGKSR